MFANTAGRSAIGVAAIGFDPATIPDRPAAFAALGRPDLLARAEPSAGLPGRAA